MTEVSPPNYEQSGTYTAVMDRRMLMTLFSGRPGVLPRTATFTDLKVTQRGSGANMSVDVAEGVCAVLGTEATYQGSYYCENQGVKNVTITAANATNPRRDLIVARVQNSEYSGAVNTFTIEVVTGTAAASPVDPTVPANCLVLARVAVAANATSITNAVITDLRTGYAAVTGSAVIGNQVRAAAPGGVVVCSSSWRPTTGLYEGLMIYETDTQLQYVYTGSAWLRMSTYPGARIRGGTYVGTTDSGGGLYIPLSPVMGTYVTAQLTVGDVIQGVIPEINRAGITVGATTLATHLKQVDGSTPYASSLTRIDWLLVDIP